MSAAVEPARGPTLTDQQAGALDVADASVALSAGAGCGKTLVLTRRFLRCLEPPERRPLRSIVALTFTEKAARELRDRVRRACRERLERGEDAAYWRAVQRGLEAAPIGTFHAFCGALLRRFPVEARVEPGFRVLEESIAPSLRDDALARLVRRWLAEGDADFRALAVEFGLGTVRQAITDLVAERGGHDYAAWAARDVAAILETWERHWEENARPRILARLEPVARRVLDLVASHPCAHPVMADRIAWLRDHLPAVAAAARPEALLPDIRENARVQGGGTAKHWPDPAVFERVKDALADLRKACDGCLEALDVDRAASALAAEHGLRFARLAAQAVEAFDGAKRDEGLLDFNDLIVKARDLLRDGPLHVREQLRAEYGVILVDEFQDTDPLQAEIVALLAGPDLARGRVFLVGDTKQSIYGFRGARPELFDRHRDAFPESGRRALTENFRSGPGIIHFVNALFCEHFEGRHHRLEARRERHAPAATPAVEFVWAAETPPEGQKPDADAKRRAEARWLAHRLRQRIDAGWEVWDREADAPRHAHAGDVVFLLRSLNDSASYENALVEAGFDYYLVGGAAFFAQQEVLDLINVLTAVEDPSDELSLAAALRSPFFGLSDAALYWLVHARADGLPAALAGCESNAHLAPVDRARALRAARLLHGWREAKDRVPIAALLDRALDESGYEAALIAEHLGPRKRANCRKLVRMARAFDAEGRYTLADFVARLRADLRKPPREGEAATTDEAGEAVRIMSIHQAKGLEFPIVVVPDLDRRTPPPRGRVACHEALGPVVRPPEDREDGSRGDGLGWACLRAVERHEEEQEAYRLLYVAATRARDALVLSASTAPDAGPTSPALKLIDARFDRETGRLRVPLPDGLPAPRISVVLEPPPRPGAKAARRRPDLGRAADAIERTLPEPPEPRPSPPRRPRRVDLDPALGLPFAQATLDRLVRAILAEPDALDPARLDEAAARAGHALRPTARPDQVAAAVALLRSWLDHAPPIPDAERLASLPWALAWPPTDPQPAVYAGRLDLAARDASGRWTVFALSVPDADPEAESLRLRLSARAARLPDDAELFLVRLDPDGPATLARPEAADPG
jgi:ATP-dependent helicase/nuclease subunit A